MDNSMGMLGMGRENEPFVLKGDYAKMARQDASGFNTPAFRESLRNGVTHFIFIKTDGSLRVAKGTKNLDYIPGDAIPTGRGNDKIHGYIETYYDVDKNAWRSVNVTKLLWSADQGLNEYAINNTKYGGDLEQDVMDLATKIINDYGKND